MDFSQQRGTIQGIARQLHISRQTVRTFIRALSFPEWQNAPRTTSAIDPSRSSLQERWNAGCRTTEQLWQEVQTCGFAGSRMLVYRWMQPAQDTTKIPFGSSSSKKRRNKTIAPRCLAWLLLNDPKKLKADQPQYFAHTG